MFISLAKTLPDGTKVAVEHASKNGRMVQLVVSKGKVHRSIGLSLAESHEAARLLAMLPKPESVP